MANDQRPLQYKALPRGATGLSLCGPLVYHRCAPTLRAPFYFRGHLFTYQDSGQPPFHFDPIRKAASCDEPTELNLEECGLTPAFAKNVKGWPCVPMSYTRRPLQSPCRSSPESLCRKAAKRRVVASKLESRGLD
jgi:hypothetical protein